MVSKRIQRPADFFMITSREVCSTRYGFSDTARRRLLTNRRPGEHRVAIPLQASGGVTMPGQPGATT